MQAISSDGYIYNGPEYGWKEVMIRVHPGLQYSEVERYVKNESTLNKWIGLVSSRDIDEAIAKYESLLHNQNGTFTKKAPQTLNEPHKR